MKMLDKVFMIGLILLAVFDVWMYFQVSQIQEGIRMPVGRWMYPCPTREELEKTCSGCAKLNPHAFDNVSKGYPHGKNKPVNEKSNAGEMSKIFRGCNALVVTTDYGVSYLIFPDGRYEIIDKNEDTAWNLTEYHRTCAILNEIFKAAGNEVHKVNWNQGSEARIINK